VQDGPEPGEDHTPNPNTPTPLVETTSLIRRKSSGQTLGPDHGSGRGRIPDDESLCEILRRVIEYTLYIFLLQLLCCILLLADYITSGTVCLPISPLPPSSEELAMRWLHHYTPRASVLTDQGSRSEDLTTSGGILFVGDVGRCRRTANRLSGGRSIRNRGKCDIGIKIYCLQAATNVCSIAAKVSGPKVVVLLDQITAST